MWPIPTLEQAFVSVLFSPEAVVCSWMEQASYGNGLLLRAYKRYPLNNLELTNLTLFNSFLIKKYISSFLSQYNLNNAFISFVLHGPAIIEQFVAMPTSTPHRADFAIPYNSMTLWEYRYIYSDDQGHYIFYVYSAPRSLILQYKLLAIAIGGNLITITTQTMTLLSAYKNIFGVAFRRSQLAVDMMKCNNNIADLITADALKRIVIDLSAKALAKEGRSIISADDRLYLASAAGAFCEERLQK